jgi:hypothetical protein
MIPKAAPSVKNFELPKLDKNYGRHETPDSVRSRKAQSKRIKLREKMKIKPTLKKVY